MCRFIDRGTWIPAFAGMTVFAALAIVTPAKAGAQFPGIGRPATPAEIKAWDIDVRPDFKGLPAGSGSVERGQAIWDAKCAQCHGTFGESNEIFQPLVGGTTAEDIRTGHAKALRTGGEARTTLMKLATISTLWDYIRRAMPWNAPKSLSTDDVYAVVAYLLNLGDLVPAGFVLSDRNIAEVQARLPNRDGLTRDHGLLDVQGKPDVKNEACMKDCATQAQVSSSLPDTALDSHGDLSQQNREVGPTRGRATPAASAPALRPVVAIVPELARRNGCLACHGIDRAVIGPAFRDVAARYRNQSGAEARLLAKLRRGGSGAWGAVPMPAQSQLADAEASALVRWLLSPGL